MFDYRSLPHRQLEDRVWSSSRSFNKYWAADELYAIDSQGISKDFLEKADSHEWTNPDHSTVLYAIGATDEEPKEYPRNLKILKGRASPPDIDIDIDDRKRDQVIHSAREKYGTMQVSQICTFNTIGSKSAIRDAARALGYQYGLGDRLAKAVPEPVMGVAKTLEESLQSAKFREEVESDPDAQKVLKTAMGLEGLVRHWGMHAGGVVVAKSDITDFVPIMKRGIDEPAVTQWDMHRVEQFGQLKIDFLGLRNLGVIDMCIENIQKRGGDLKSEDDIPLDDEATYEALCKGKSIGCFQIEGSGMRQMMVDMQPSSIRDLMALVALYRPGPMGSGMDKLYIAKKHGRNISGFHHFPILDELLPNSRGVLLYQEDLLKIAREVAGFSAEEADSLRKVVGKKIVDKMASIRNRFVSGCEEVGRISKREADLLFSDIEHHANYSFNLAHAVSYAFIAYQTAYLKTHYPAEYMAALLSSISKPEKMALYLNECRSMGIFVLPPSINDSEENFSVISDNQILFGLGSIRGIGEAILERLMNSRTEEPFASIYDFMRRCDYELLNKTTLEHLLFSGAMDELFPDQPHTKLTRDEKMEILKVEREELGLFITEHPLEGIWHLLGPQTTHEVAEVQDLYEGERVKIAGIVSIVSEKTTKRGDSMYVLDFEDLSGPVRVVVFPPKARRKTFEVGDILYVEGRVKVEGDDENSIRQIIFEDGSTPELPEMVGGVPIMLEAKCVPQSNKWSQINNIIESNPGDSFVYLKVKIDGATITYKSNRSADPSIAEEIKKVLI